MTASPRARSQTCSYYLLRRPKYQVTVASLNLWKAERFATDLPREAKCISLNLNNAEVLDKAVFKHDLIISLVPYMHHAKIINSAIEFKKNVVTTSYVSPAMRAPDDQPKKAGIIGLNKIGLDSGINHLQAVKMINTVRRAGGKIIKFISYCCDLPAECSKQIFFTWGSAASFELS
ncbi:saccharopine dehydrogenase [Puccinia triticina 1-1 BBBD Race 1]|uniref:Saccharopine dehydrogenase n=2 Tax=Puccinia triticina TaxID=208348 RepID=A0A180GLN2_PUCT1|nr:uncharacterized protein PtA15_14A275 [Puccinia triticina]OAV92873.1 saccharopine dehydrogenase [Puccinia triticina 1-1 BBBD Race 1]WAQ91392.1 hypothetical protein PtA15_14A275 [Puccinia triticina]WAR62191.1 hypothetical protein PtB15_14B285 [Puccinia triticina]